MFMASKPWSRVHIDFMGPLFNKVYLAIVNSHSKWPEIFEMYSTTSSMTIVVLRQVFATVGIHLLLCQT